MSSVMSLLRSSLECCGSIQPSIQEQVVFHFLKTDEQQSAFSSSDCFAIRREHFLNGGLRRAAALQGFIVGELNLWSGNPELCSVIAFETARQFARDS